jgi:hypothetical protein
LTFSKSAWLGLAVSTVYIFIKVKVPQWNKCSVSAPSSENFPSRKQIYSTPVKMFHVEHFTGQAWNILRGKHGTFSGFTGWNNSNTTGVKHSTGRTGNFIGDNTRALLKYGLLITLIVLLLIFILKPDINSLFIRSIGDRIIYLETAYNSILAHPWLGLGAGQFVLHMQQYSNLSLESWQFQPVHNVFLLIWAELGIFGFLAFIQIMFKMYKTEYYSRNKGKRNNNVPSRKPKCSTPVQMFHVEHFTGQAWNILNTTGVEHFEYYRSEIVSDHMKWQMLICLKAILIAFIVIMLFDHYFWDIQQGQIMLWMVLGFIVSMKYQRNK